MRLTATQYTSVERLATAKMDLAPGDNPAGAQAAPSGASPSDGGKNGPDQGRALSPSAVGGLRLFFYLAGRVPRLVRMLRPLGIALALCGSAAVRRGTATNARRILGAGTSRWRCLTFAAGVVGAFYDFVTDVAACARLDADELRNRIDGCEGHEAYLAHRRTQQRGAIVVTIHMGSFEVGLAALAAVEKNIHVVFKRDGMNGYELMRGKLRQTLGIIETPIDDGWETWIKLRDALTADQVVVMQGDRAMPGQKAQPVPMFGAHLLLPLGPVKLAAITGSPIVPVFTVRQPSGRCRLFVEPPIYADPHAGSADGVDAALLQLGRVIEKYVRRYPQQWLVLSPAFFEDGSTKR